MRRRHFIKTIGLGTLGIGIAPLVHAQRNSVKQPNMIILFADDVGWGDLGCYGNPEYQTPHLDQMAAEGMRLTSFYGAPTCSPSRIALLTGRYPVRSGLGRNWGGGVGSDTGIPESEITLAEALKQEGYRTKMVGKWHLGFVEARYLPTANGFDSWFGLPYSNDMQKPWVQTDVPLKLYRNTEPVEYPVNQSTLTTRYTEEAVSFIQESDRSPFFLYLAYSMAHLPLHTTETFQGSSEASLYGDIMQAIDWSAGQVLSAVKQQGLDDNTIVVFTSDNGPWLELPDRMLQAGIRPWHAGSPGPFRKAKATTYEGGMRVPGIVRWPGRIPAGHTSNAITSNMDLFPTFLKLAGGKPPKDRSFDGADLMPLLTGNATSARKDFFYFRGGDRLQAVREGEWKLRYTASNRDDLNEGDPVTPELFHLKRDPSERYNVAVEYPDIVDKLKKKMVQFAQEVDAEIEIPQNERN